MAIISVCSACKEPVEEGVSTFACKCGTPYYDSGTKEYWLALREELGDEGYEDYCERQEMEREMYGPALEDHPMYEYMHPSDPWGP